MRDLTLADATDELIGRHLYADQLRTIVRVVAVEVMNDTFKIVKFVVEQTKHDDVPRLNRPESGIFVDPCGGSGWKLLGMDEWPEL